MIECPYQSEPHNFAALLSGDKTGFVPQSVGHASFVNTINGIASVSRTEGHA